MNSPCKKPLFNEKQIEWIRAMASDSPPPLCDYSKLTPQQRFDLRKHGVPIPILVKRKSDVLSDADHSTLTRDQRYYFRKNGAPIPLLPRGHQKGVEQKIKRYRGADCPWWKGDKATVKAGRARARKMYPLGPCEVCGKEKTERHHKDDNPLNNEPDNISILCRRHHLGVDGRLQRLIEISKARLKKGKK